MMKKILMTAKAPNQLGATCVLANKAQITKIMNPAPSARKG
jgi:hypothetical protein